MGNGSRDSGPGNLSLSLSGKLEAPLCTWAAIKSHLKLCCRSYAFLLLAFVVKLLSSVSLSARRMKAHDSLSGHTKHKLYVL